MKWIVAGVVAIVALALGLQIHVWWRESQEAREHTVWITGRGHQYGEKGEPLSEFRIIISDLSGRNTRDLFAEATEEAWRGAAPLGGVYRAWIRRKGVFDSTPVVEKVELLYLKRD